MGLPIFFTPAPLHNINTDLENRVLRRSGDLQSQQLGLGSACQQWKEEDSLKNLVDLHVSKQEQQRFIYNFSKFIFLLFPTAFEFDFCQNVCRGYSVGCYIYICIYLGLFDLANLSGHLQTMGEEKSIEE